MNNFLHQVKKLTLLLTTVFFMPNIAFSDAADFDEIDYVFRSFESEIPAEIQDCYDIGFFSPTSFTNFDLYSLQSKKTNGKVLKDNIKKIGHVLTCVDFTGVSLENPFVTTPARFKVTIDGMELIVEGQGNYRSLDVPEPLLGMAVYSLRIVEGPSNVVGGWLVTNTISNALGVPGYVNGSFATIRLFTPAVEKGPR